MLIDDLTALIQDRRRKTGLSQKQLAAAAGVSRTTLSHVEQGKAPHVQMDVLARILRALEVAPRLSVDGLPDPGRLAARMAHREQLHAQRARHLRLAVELAADAKAARGKIARAKKSVELWRRNRTCSPQYVRRWTELLALPPSQLARRMASLAEWEDAMFQNTPWSWAWN